MRPKRGLCFALLAALLASSGGFLCITGIETDPTLTSLSSTLVRIGVNLVFVLFVQFIVRGERSLPWGTGDPELWLWGALGAFTILTYFASLQALGPGEATLLQGVQGFVVAALAPRFLRQRSSLLTWAAVCGGLGGLAIAFPISVGATRLEGRALALASGLFAGSAYLVLSATKGRHKPDTISFYWCVVSLVIAGAAAALNNATLPLGGPGIPWLIAAGFAGSLAQWFTTLAYRTAPAAMVASTAYLIPLFSLLGDAFVRQKHVESHIWHGAILVVAAGVGLPILQARNT